MWLVPVVGGPPKRLVEGGAPVWLDDERLVIAVERDASTRLAVLARLEAPLLVANGERDERANPRQSEELVAALRRLGKTFEYVTYPTEGHGLLCAGPQLHFYRRLERFLDWYLL